MVLVYGHANDSNIQLVVAALHAAGGYYQLLDAAALAQAALHLQVGPRGITGEIVVAGACTALADIHAVYTRPCKPAQQHALAIHRQLLEWLDMAPALIVNRPAVAQRNASTPWQVQQMGEAGFLVPPMLVTSDAAEARAFRCTHGRVVSRSMGGSRSIATGLNDTWLSCRHRLAEWPTHFHAHVPGMDVIVYVVGQQALAAELGFAAAAPQWVATTLPPAIAAQCVVMSQGMGLPLSGIHLRLRPNGEYVCLKVDPIPAFGTLEAESGLPIAVTLAALLVDAK